MSKLRVDADVLGREVRLARRFVLPHAVKPVLGHMAVRVENGTATLAATDLDMTYTRTFQAEGEGRMELLVQPAILAAVARECRGMLELHDQATEQGPRCVIRHASPTRATANVPAGTIASEFRLIARDTEEFPAIDPVPQSMSVATIDVAEFLDVLGYCLLAIGNYPVCIRPFEDSAVLWVAATDGHRLALDQLRRSVAKPTFSTKLEMEEGQAKRLLGLLKQEDAATVDLRYDPTSKRASFVGPTWAVTFTMAPARQMPERAWEMHRREETVFAQVNAADMARAFRDAMKIVKGEDADIELRIRAKAVVISATSPAGQVERSIAATTRGQVDLVVPADHLAPFLKQARDWVGICATDEWSPALFLCSNRDRAGWYIAGQKRPKTRTQSPVAVEA